MRAKTTTQADRSSFSRREPACRSRARVSLIKICRRRATDCENALTRQPGRNGVKNRANETAFVIGSALRYKELYRYRERKSERERKRKKREERRGESCLSFARCTVFNKAISRRVSLAISVLPITGIFPGSYNVMGADCVRPR